MGIAALGTRIQAPVGIFDSGVGGLSVMRALMERVPHERFVYVADSAHCPYGSRSPDQVLAFSMGITRYLVEKGVKLVVVACNTASAVALTALREHFPSVHFVGMVPAVKPAVSATHSGVVGVMATAMTLSGQLYRDVVEHLPHAVRVVAQPCHGLVEQVEAGDLDSSKTMLLLRECVEPLLEAGADTLVLGCTHYPFLIPALRRLVGEDMPVLEPSDAIARRAEQVLAQDGLLSPASQDAEAHFATTGDMNAFKLALQRLLSYTGPAVHLQWQGDVLGDQQTQK